MSGTSRLRKTTRAIKRVLIQTPIDVIALPVTVLACIFARFCRRPIDVGLGPDPLINNVYHKSALEKAGYSAETFVWIVWHIIDRFDYRADKELARVWRYIRVYVFFLRAVFRYKSLYIYFNGGPLSKRGTFRRLEPHLLKLAGVKVVVMPYGSDVMDMTRARNHLFTHGMSLDYPAFRRQRLKVVERIDRWTRHADHIISGCDWVDYLYHWDTLMLAHFSIDTAIWTPPEAAHSQDPDRPLRLLHAPNHRNIKGTEHFIRAVRELQEEGVAIELEILERTSNDVVREVMAEVDVVCDQLIIGWYAMFALEAMSMGKPVICYLRQDLKELYVAAGLIEPDELPHVEATVFTVKEALRSLAAKDRSELREIGRKSRAFVEKHHSLAAIGQVFAAINESIGIQPSLTAVAAKPADKSLIETKAIGPALKG